MRHCVLTLAVVAVGYLATCNSRGHNYEATNTIPEDTVTVVRPVSAILNEGTHPTISATETQIPGKPGPPFQFWQAQFITETHGWAMTSYSLHRTTDGGKSWERLSQEPEKEARFKAFSFVDELHGWLVSVKADSAEHYGVGFSSAIMVTNDGGRSWNVQANFQDEVRLHYIRFLNKNEGLAVGYKGLDNRADHGEIFMLGTSNGGEDWKDVSGPVKAAFRNQWGAANDAGRDIQWTSSSVFMLTQGGRVMNTTDEGKTWKTIVILKHERPNPLMSSTGYYKLALDPQQNIRVLAGKSGDEGYLGDFVVNEEGQWRSYEIGLTPIHDAVFLSDKDVIACGLNVRTKNEKAKRLKDAGVILRSFDG